MIILKVNGFGLSPYQADQLVSLGPEVCDYYESISLFSLAPKRCYNWIIEFIVPLEGRSFKIPPDAMGYLISLIENGEITTGSGKIVYEALLEKKNEKS